MFTKRLFGLFQAIQENINSITLLADDNFIQSVDTYTIRLHQTLRPNHDHFDIAFGSIKNKGVQSLCFDFVIGGVSPNELRKKNLIFADLIQFRLNKGAQSALMLPQEAHPCKPFLTYDEGEGESIPEGEKGAGKWRIIKKGTARLKKVVDKNHRIHYDLYLDSVGNQYYPFYMGGNKWFINIKKT